MTRTLLVLLASAILALSGVSGQKIADCKTKMFDHVTSQPNGGSFTKPFVAGTGLVLTEAVTFGYFDKANADDVVELGITVAPTANCAGSSSTPGAAQLQLGLYNLVSNNLFVLQAQTPTFTLTESQVAQGITISKAVLFQGLTPLTPTGTYSIGFATNNANLCLEGNTQPTLEAADRVAFNPAGLPASFTPTAANNDFLASALVCTSGQVVGDPVFTGLQGQQFTVKGEAGSVFNLINAPNMQFNNRFVALASDKESMNSTAMKAARAQFKHSKLLDLVKAESSRPPATTAWNHPGTYMGESGITLGDSQLYIAPGAYLSGFSSVTLDGETVAISSRAIELDGDITVTRPSAFKVVISTPSVRFTIVNSDNFVNIEHAKVLSVDAQLTGLLGQTADAEWEVVQTAEFVQHLENDFKVASNKLF